VGVVARRWSDLSQQQHFMIIVGVAVEGVLKLAMLLDLRRRPAEQVKGPKWAWATSALINTAGVAPLAYFVVGRKRQPNL
jgi:hypothetical protein